MTCEEFIRELDDAGRVATPEARAHAGDCPACAGAAERWRAVRGELRALGEEPPPPFLHARVMAHVRVESASSRRPAWWARVPRWAWAAQALALVLGVTLAGWSVWQVRTSRQAGEAVLAEKAAPRPNQALGKEAAAGERRQVRTETAADTGTVQAPAMRPAPAPRQAGKGQRKVAPPPVAPTAPAVLPPAAFPYSAPSEVPAPPPATDDAGRARAAAKDERAYAADAWAPEPPAEAARRDQAAAAGAPPAAEADARLLGAAKPKLLPVRRERPVLACVATRVDAPGTVAFWLTDDLAPRPGEAIAFAVTRDGRVDLVEAHDREQARDAILAARLRDMRLPPGRYRLTRAVR